MWGILAELAKPLFKFAFGTPKATKITMTLLAISLLAGATWYLTHKYAQMELKNTALINENEKFAVAQTQLTKALSDQAIKYAKQQAEIKDASDKQAKLASEIVKLQEERKDEQSIFNRKTKTFQEMLNRRGETIIKLANRGTERVRLKWTKEINNLSDRLQEGAGNMLTSPKNTETNPPTN